MELSKQGVTILPDPEQQLKNKSLKIKRSIECEAFAPSPRLSICSAAEVGI